MAIATPAAHPAVSVEAPAHTPPAAVPARRWAALSLDERLLRLAVLYALLGIGMGLAMSITHDFTNKGVHVHVNLLGWVSMALMALGYRQFPRMARSPLARVHFWLHGLGLPVMAVGIYMVLHQLPNAEPVVAGGSLAVAAAFASFALNVWLNAFGGEERKAV
jgi:hypothetical protein